MSVPFRVDLSGKTAVVTGGGGVLCSCFAEALGECGAKVAVLDLSLDAADAVAKRICANGGTAQAFACNVLEKESILAAGDAVIAAFGNIDILINGAGGNNPRATTDREYLFPEDLTGEADGKSFFDLTPEGIQFVFNLNCLGTLLPTQVFARNMAVHGGIIINISSMNAYRPLTKIPAYSAAKAAVSNLTMWLAVHLSKVNIRVNAIAPGFFVTKQNEKLLFDDNGILHRVPIKFLHIPRWDASASLKSLSAHCFISAITTQADLSTVPLSPLTADLPHIPAYSHGTQNNTRP